MIERIYRIEHNGSPRHAVERGGEWRLVEGDLFGHHEPGAVVAAGVHRLMAPVMP